MHAPHRLVVVLVGFWAVWFTVVTASNIADALKGAGMLPEGWRFASGNLEQVAAVTSIYGVPRWAVEVLFVGVIVVELVAAALFWRSLFMRDAELRQMQLDRAIAVGAALFAGFLLADEVFIAYATGLARPTGGCWWRSR
jgi:hypothetical protein